LSGTGVSAAGVPPAWAQRRLRTRKWLAREPPAEAMLELYLELLDLQEPLYHEARAAGWKQIDALPFASLVPRFRRFVREVEPAATEVLAARARSLETADAAAAANLLADFLDRHELEGVAAEFYPRAFLQPIAEAVVEDMDDAGDGLARLCPRCGWPPQVGVLRDEPDLKGARLLVCSLCSSSWRYRRARCPRCAEDDPEKLVHHLSEALPHVRVDACRTCNGYLKTVDLRKDGLAVPLVEDLATVELDLWCVEQGWEKIRRNLMGL
jgi:FdhE protein